MLNVFAKFYKIEKKQHEIMLNTFSLSLIIWKTAIETCAQEMNAEAGNELGTRRAEQFPHLGNYTLTLCIQYIPNKRLVGYFYVV